MDSIEHSAPSGDEPCTSTRTPDLVKRLLATHGSMKVADIPGPVQRRGRSVVDRILADHGSVPLAEIRYSAEQTQAELDRRGLTAAVKDAEAAPTRDFAPGVVDGNHRVREFFEFLDFEAPRFAETSTEVDVLRQLAPRVRGEAAEVARDGWSTRGAALVHPETLAGLGGLSTGALALEYLPTSTDSGTLTALRSPWQLSDAELVARHHVELMLLKLARAVQASRFLPPPEGDTAPPQVSTSPCGVLRLRVREVPRAPGHGGHPFATDHQRGTAA